MSTTERGRGRGGTAFSDMRDASQVRGLTALGVYTTEHRDRVHEQVLQETPALRARIDTAAPESDELEAAEDELWTLSTAVMRREYAALPAGSKDYYQRQEKEQQANAWRRLRNNGRLIENEASLAQKAEDDRAMAAGAPKEHFTGYGHGAGRGRGRGGADGTVSVAIGAHANACSYGRHEVIPPFDSTINSLKVGVVTKEEYF